MQAISLAAIVASAAILVACSGEDSSSSANLGGSGGADAAQESSLGGNSGAAGQDTDGAIESSTGADASSLDGIEQACKAMADALCAKYQSCLALNFSQAFADLAACSQQLAADCEAESRTEGSHASTASRNACAEALAALTDCTAVVENALGQREIPACNASPGDRADGESCWTGWQCSSAYCEFGTDLCGTCRAVAGEGEDCSGAVCRSGLACVESVCTKKPALGEACSAKVYTNACDGLLACMQGVCVEHADIGDPCTSTPQNDHCRPTGWCNESTGVCEPYGDDAVSGDPCGILENGSIEYCGTGFRCRITDKTHFKGTCESADQSGDACESLYAIGDSCMQPTMCIEGTCQQPDYSVCK